MRSLIIVAFVACAFVAASANPVPEIDDEPSQLAMFESDEVEVAGLGEDKAIFKDFCIQARDEVKSYLKDSVNSGTARVFNLIVDTVAEVTSAIAKANSAAVKEGSQRINEDARQVKSAVTGLASAFTGTAKEQLIATFKHLKYQLTVDNLKEIADEACVSVAMKLKPSIDSKFSAFKKSMLRSPGGDKFAEVLSKTRIENLGCVTTGRLSKVATGCNMIRTLGPSLLEFAGRK